MAERSAKQLGLSKADLPNSIIEVIATLNKNGFDAYIVGGGVRDTLLGLNPKDFDAVTDAKPHEIKDIFGKRCRIIGRRFQLAHVYSGRDMIEVATFRAPPNGDAHTTSDGMIVRDNVWGDIKQDFVRRDFSINALYYDPIKGVVHDFCNALDDIKNQTLKLLGHAPLRIEEDPVRLLRALRFKAKLGFEFDKELSEQFHENNWALLDQVSPHRLYDESQKMFTGGYLVPLLPLLFEYGAIEHLIIYPPKTPTALVEQVAVNTDKRIAIGKSINPAFFYAALLWDNYLYQLAKFKQKKMPFNDAQVQAASKVIDRQRIKTAIPRFAEQFIRDIWLLQPKLANPRIKQIVQLAEHPRFRAAFDFLLLREQCDDESNPLSESTNEMGEWWQTYQTLSEKQKRQAIDDFANDNRRSPSKSSRKRKNRRNGQDSQGVHNPEQTSNLPNGQASRVKSSTFKKDNDDTELQKRYAKERAQLQKLSLDGTLAGAASSTDSQPSPLFTINAKKMAQQVPKQLNVASQAANQASSQTSKGSKVSDKPAPASATATQNRQPQDVQSIEKNTKADDSDSVAKEKQKADLLATSKPVPAKRRRRMPSQAMTQAELLRAKQQNKPVTQSTLEAEKRTTSEQTTSLKPNQVTKEPALDSLEKVTKADNGKSNLKSASIAIKNERVPAHRRRRPPSSTKSVSERINQR